jgi:hypothetical protein
MIIDTMIGILTHFTTFWLGVAFAAHPEYGILGRTGQYSRGAWRIAGGSLVVAGILGFFR